MKKKGTKERGKRCGRGIGRSGDGTELAGSRRWMEGGRESGKETVRGYEMMRGMGLGGLRNRTAALAIQTYEWRKKRDFSSNSEEVGRAK